MLWTQNWDLYLFCLYMVNYFQPLKLTTNCRPLQCVQSKCTNQHVVQLRQLSRKTGLYSNHLQERLQRRTNEEERNVWSRIAWLAEHGTAFSRVVAVKYGGWCCNPSRATNARNVCTHGTVRLNWSGTGEQKERRGRRRTCLLFVNGLFLSTFFPLSSAFCVDVGLSSLIIPSPNADE